MREGNKLSNVGSVLLQDIEGTPIHFLTMFCELVYRVIALTLCDSAKTINVSSPDDPSEQSEEFLELANGCLCCSIKDSGVAAIEKLMQRKGAFDHILLETTGLADPGTPTSACTYPPTIDVIAQDP